MAVTLSETALQRGGLDFERLISETSASLMAAPLDSIDVAIEVALDRVRTFFAADRCALIAVSADQHLARVSHASYAEGIDRVSGDINLVELFPWARGRLLDDRAPVVVDRVADLPPEAAVDRESWESMSAHSNLAVPIEVGGRVSHILAVHVVQPGGLFRNVNVERLRTFGELCANALQRKQSFDALRLSEARLHRTAAAAHCGLWEVDLSTGRIWVTPETNRIYGLPEDHDATTWERFMDLLLPEYREPIATKVADIVAHGGLFDEVYRIRRDDGSTRWIHATGQPQEGHLLLGAAMDVTEQTLAEERARLETARVAAAIDVAGLGFSDSMVSGPAFVDARLRELLGLGPPTDGEAIPEFWFSRIHPEDAPRIAEERRKLSTGEIDLVVAEYRYEHPTRGWIWLRHNSRRYASPEGGARLIGAVQDITAQRTREADLKHALDELQRLREQLQGENLYLRQESQRTFGAKQVVGRSPAIRSALALAEQVAATNATVLLTGETGTGKERFATLIHESSPRRGRTMVRINCAAIPSSLIESELFGRERGAYTGALSKQIGRFEIADGSTLFLDEIGDLPLEVQIKLLRVLQERTFERLGSPRSLSVDVRIIAATNRDLEEAVRDGSFRSDLFYRLNVFPIHVPPLRERREDIADLVTALVEEIGATLGKRFDSVARTSLDALRQHPWPGNIRELRNVIERAMIVEAGPVLRIAVTGAPSAPDAATAGAPARSLRDVEREHLLRVLGETGWRVRGRGGAAEVLGLKPTTLEARIARLGIRRPRGNGVGIG